MTFNMKNKNSHKTELSSFIKIFEWLYENTSNILDSEAIAFGPDIYPTGKAEAASCLEYFMNYIHITPSIDKKSVYETEEQYIVRTGLDMWLPTKEWYFEYRNKIYVYSEISDSISKFMLRANSENDIDYKPQKMWKNKVIKLGY